MRGTPRPSRLARAHTLRHTRVRTHLGLSVLTAADSCGHLLGCVRAILCARGQAPGRTSRLTRAEGPDPSCHRRIGYTPSLHTCPVHPGRPGARGSSPRRRTRPFSPGCSPTWVWGSPAGIQPAARGSLRPWPKWVRPHCGASTPLQGRTQGQGRKTLRDGTAVAGSRIVWTGE